MSIFQAIILAIIEGLTEFLPVSSTGHMILASSLMHLHDEEFVHTFEIVIQIGAILAIVSLYSKRFLSGINIYFKLATAFLPTAVIGFLAYNIIKTYLFSPLVVAISLIIGGVILILIDKRVINSKARWEDVENISYKNAFFIGLMQCFSMIPGVSRAAATIIGGVFNGLNKKQAAEFSFLLAVPTMFAASGYDLFKSGIDFTQEKVILIAIGMVGAFVSALIAVKFFIKIIERYGFKHFGYYRIIIGIIFLLIIGSEW